MRTNRSALLVLICAIGTAQAASAADMPAAAPVYKAPAAVVAYNWSGVYIGANVGAARQKNCWTFVSPGPDPEGCHSDTGVVAGGQIGVNWQTGNLVFGLEASGDWANLKASNVSTAFPIFTNETSTDAIGLFTGRFGVAWNNALVYVKGGAAVTNNKYRTSITPLPQFFDVVKDTRWGWTAGVGLEYGFMPNWSAAIEYDYVDTGSKDESFTTEIACAVPCVEHVSQRIHMATLRLNYRFAPWPWR
jgi:outer membrane immunogenic protein